MSLHGLLFLYVAGISSMVLLNEIMSMIHGEACMNFHDRLERMYIPALAMSIGGATFLIAMNLSDFSMLMLFVCVVATSAALIVVSKKDGLEIVSSETCDLGKDVVIHNNPSLGHDGSYSDYGMPVFDLKKGGVQDRDDAKSDDDDDDDDDVINIFDLFDLFDDEDDYDDDEDDYDDDDDDDDDDERELDWDNLDMGELYEWDFKNSTDGQIQYDEYPRQIMYMLYTNPQAIMYNKPIFDDFWPEAFGEYFCVLEYKDIYSHMGGERCNINNVPTYATISGYDVVCMAFSPVGNLEARYIILATNGENYRYVTLSRIGDACALIEWRQLVPPYNVIAEGISDDSVSNVLGLLERYFANFDFGYVDNGWSKDEYCCTVNGKVQHEKFPDEVFREYRKGRADRLTNPDIAVENNETGATEHLIEHLYVSSVRALEHDTGLNAKYDIEDVVFSEVLGFSVAVICFENPIRCSEAKYIICALDSECIRYFTVDRMEGDIYGMCEWLENGDVLYIDSSEEMSDDLGETIGILRGVLLDKNE